MKEDAWVVVIRVAPRTAGRPTLEAIRATVCGVVIVLAGLGFLLAPATPVGAQPPAQGWTTTEAPLPTDAGNGSTNPEVYTAGSSCPAVNACVIAGWYNDTNGKSWGLIENQNGTTWTDTEAPQPNNAGSGTNQGLRIGAANCGGQLPCRPLSCPTVSFCLAVGQFNDTAGYVEPLVETFANGSWSATQGPLPSDAAFDSGPTNFPDAWLSRPRPRHRHPAPRWVSTRP